MKKETKTRKFYVWATDEEAAEVCRRTEEAGIKYPSVYMLRMALHGYIVHTDMTDVHEILRLVNITSKNVNQYARRANQDGSIFEEDIQNILDLMQKIIELIGDVIDRLEELEE